MSPTPSGLEYGEAARTAIRAAAIATRDFAGWLAAVLCSVAAGLGSSAAPVQDRPGSWRPLTCCTWCVARSATTTSTSTATRQARRDRHRFALMGGAVGPEKQADGPRVSSAIPDTLQPGESAVVAAAFAPAPPTGRISVRSNDGYEAMLAVTNLTRLAVMSAGCLRTPTGPAAGAISWARTIERPGRQWLIDLLADLCYSYAA